MDLAHGRSDLDGKAQEVSGFDWLVHETCKRLAAEIFEDKNGPGAVLHELQRPRRPGAVEFVSQLKFVRETIEPLRCWMLRGREHRQYEFSFAVDALTPGSAQQNPFVIVQELRAMGPTFAHK